MDEVAGRLCRRSGEVTSAPTARPRAAQLAALNERSPTSAGAWRWRGETPPSLPQAGGGLRRLHQAPESGCDGALGCVGEPHAFGQPSRRGAQPAAPLEAETEGGGEAGVEGQLRYQLGEKVLGAAVLAARALAVHHLARLRGWGWGSGWGWGRARGHPLDAPGAGAPLGRPSAPGGRKAGTSLQ